MPQIKIVSSPSNDSNSSELFLLEFQGKFETNGNVSLAGMEIGKLDLSGVKQPILQDKPVYYVGNQRLIGKEVKLAKPLAILRQSKTNSSCQNTQQTNEISVVNIIKKKILFDSRPITKMN